MSLSTPILTTPSEIWACAPAHQAQTPATNSEIKLRFICPSSRRCPDCCFSETSAPEDSNAQVLMQHAAFRVQFGGGEPFHDAAMLHHVKPVRQRCGEPEVLLDHH